MNDLCTFAEMPRYRSHKIVHALKIARIEIYPGNTPADDRHGEIFPEDKVYAPLKVSADWLTRYKGYPEDLGYYVVYDGGYASWSPTKAFEDGYTRL